MRRHIHATKHVGILLGLVMALTARPAAADKVFVDFDHDVDFAAFETFTYSPVKKGLLAQDEQIDGWIVDGVVERLIAGGLTQVGKEDDPDLVISYAMSTETSGRIDVTAVTPVGVGWGAGWGWGVGYGPGWGYAGGVWYTPTTMRSSYITGTLVIVAYDTETKLGVWSGTAEISPGKNPHKTHQKIDKALDKIGQKWRSLHAKANR